MTQMDRGSESLLVETIIGQRPEDSLRGEEGGSRDGSTGITWSSIRWTGRSTTCTACPCGRSAWVCSMATGRSSVVVHAPALGSVARVASPHPMAELNGTPIAASQCPTLGEALVGTGFGYQADVRTAGPNRRGAPAASPRYPTGRRGGCRPVLGGPRPLDGYYERGTHLWDRAAGTAIAQAAGARVGGLDGGPATDSMTIAAGARLFDPLREQLTELGAT